MKALIFGGAGFVGLNITEAMLRAGHDVVVFDRQLPPASAREMLATYGSRVVMVEGDVTNGADVSRAIALGTDAIVYGAAITAGATRDASEPERILAVNLSALAPVLRAAKAAGVRRVVNLSSVGALGRAVGEASVLTEDLRPDPASLYSLTKFASERLVDRLADLWSIEAVSVRLSAVFGPWEYSTGVRDTISPPGQLMGLAALGTAALLARPGERDWLYAPDVGAAVLALLQAQALSHRLYNVTSGAVWPLLTFGERLMVLRPGFVCRLAAPDETPTVDLYMAKDRPPLSPERLADDLQWRAHHDLDRSLAHFDAWSRAWGDKLRQDTA